MSCFYCWQQTINTPHAGSCTVCTRPVCIRPSVRADGEYHADVCICGCGKLVCEQDVQTHSRHQHQSDASKCFTLLTLMTGVPALSGVLARDTPTQNLPAVPAQAISRFLNSAGPGANALRSATTNVTLSGLSTLGLRRDVPSPGAPPDVTVTPEFLDMTSRRERVGAAVGYALGDAWRRVQAAPSGRVFLDEFGDEAPPALERLLATLARNTRRPEARPDTTSQRAAGTILGVDEAQALRRLAGKWWLVGFDREVAWFEDVVKITTPPADPDEMASWLLFGDERDLTPTVPRRLRTRGA